MSLSGTGAVAGDSVQLYNGTTPLGSAVSLSGTNISNGFVDITTAALSNGTTYNFRAAVIDAAGNASAESTDLPSDITIDTTAPNAPSITSVTDDASPVTGPVADGGSTNDTTPTIRVSLSGTGAVAGDSVQLYNGTTPLGSAVSLSGTNISNGFVDITTAALSNGTTYNFRAAVIDAAGNTSAESTDHAWDITIDTTAPNAPSITSVTDDASPVTGPVADGGSTNDTTPTIRVSLSGTGAVAGDSVQLYNGTTPLGSAVSLSGTNISNGFVDITTAALSNGTTYNFRAAVIDAAGNTSAKLDRPCLGYHHRHYRAECAVDHVGDGRCIAGDGAGGGRWQHQRHHANHPREPVGHRRGSG